MSRALVGRGRIVLLALGRRAAARVGRAVGAAWRHRCRVQVATGRHPSGPVTTYRRGMTTDTPAPATSPVRTIARVLLAAFLVFAGVGHFVAPQEFLAQVPPWMPAPLLVVYASGVVEVALGAGLLGPRRWRPLVGLVVAGFFVVIFPGNLSQALTGAEAFGLDSDAARWGRLAFQPVFVVWALWSTGAWAALAERRRQQTPGGNG